MPKKEKQPDCCGPDKTRMGYCNVEGFAQIDERGQMVLPKEVREKAGLSAGDKLVIVTCESDGKVSVISLIRSEEFSGMVKDFLGPAMGEIFGR
jgi:AbrB family looped-hinge helix DNA binding protein